MAALPNKPLTRRLLIALIVSLLLHLWLTGGISLPTFVEVEPPPIEARLSGAVVPSRPAPPAKARAKPELPVLAPSAPVAASAVPSAGSGGLAVPASPPSPVEAPDAIAAALPAAFKIRFAVQGNEGGLVLGRLDHVWRRNGTRYSLVGVAEASGLFALFYSGLLTQTSDGEVVEAGLRPENYWMQRGRKRYSVHFDWPRQAARLGDPYGTVTLAPGMQDYLSVVYQLALFPHPAEGRVTVVDGKRVKEYGYRELGPETVELPMGRVETRHLRIGQGDGDGDMELWLRAQAPHLPLMMFLIDDKGRKGVLLAETIE